MSIEERKVIREEESFASYSVLSKSSLKLHRRRLCRKGMATGIRYYERMKKISCVYSAAKEPIEIYNETTCIAGQTVERPSVGQTVDIPKSKQCLDVGVKHETCPKLASQPYYDLLLNNWNVQDKEYG